MTGKGTSDTTMSDLMQYGSEEPVVDIRSRNYDQTGPSQDELAGHRQLFIGVSVPHQRNRHDYRRRRHHPRRSKDKKQEGPLDPSQHVMFLLGSDDAEDDSHPVPHTMFCEMDEFLPQKNSTESQWRESARWVKFEEDVEDGGERWSKPHVATLSVYYLFELRKCLEQDPLLLNLDATTIEEIMELVVNKEILDKRLQAEDRDKIRQVLLQRHTHLHDKKHRSMAHTASHLPLIRSIAEIGRKHSSKDMEKAMYRRRHSEAVTSTSRTNNDAEPGMRPLLELGNNSLPSLRKTNSSGQLEKRGEVHPGLGQSPSNDTATDLSQQGSTAKFDTHFLKKIPPGSETCNILVGEVAGLAKQFSCFVRLREAHLLGDLTEVPVPTRFIFILLGPPPASNSTYFDKYHQMGRCMGTLMSDEIFHEIAYRARQRQDLLAGLDEFISMSSILPPAEWDPTIRIEPPQSVPSQDARKAGPGVGTTPNGAPASGTGGEGGAGGAGGGAGGPRRQGSAEPEEPGHGDGLVRTGRLFGGLIDDVKRKVPHYLSDFTDARSIQILASFFFLYFACLTPIITFGGLLSSATNGNLGTIESIMSGCIVGVTYALFSGQPMTILGSTGPVLVYESIVFSVCKTIGWDYLSFRLWIGTWVSLMLLLMVMFDLSYLVRFITRFTEESFASLIALIFIKEAIMKQIHIVEDYPVDAGWTPRDVPSFNCSCMEKANNTVTASDTEKMAKTPPLIYDANGTALRVNFTAIDYFVFDWRSVATWCKKWGGEMIGPDCKPIAVPDVFFFSCLLFLNTFVIAMVLKKMRTWRCFPTRVRVIISDFAVMIAIVINTAIAVLCQFEVPRLKVPSTFEPTLTYKVRGWLIPPFRGNPWWSCLAAIPPAMLATVLIWMDQQITAVIVNRKENKLKKGAGYHLDLLLVAVLILFCSILGMPWFVAATVLSINHVMSLKRESGCTAPGERPEFLGCREQRVTGTLIFAFIGLSVLFTSVLRFIPMSVLYGVFLYMGVSSMSGVQLMQRCFIMLMPSKYQPDYVYLRHVPLRKVHFFTLCQIMCLVLLWVVKSIKAISIAFPLMVVAMVFVRYFVISSLFTEEDLRWLDDIMPEERKRRKEDLAVTDETDNLLDGEGTENIDMEEEESRINMSDELSKTSIWKNLHSSSDEEHHRSGSGEKKKHHKRHHKHRLPGKGSQKQDTILEMSPVKEATPNDGEETQQSEVPTVEITGDEKEALLGEPPDTPTIVVDPPSCEVSFQTPAGDEETKA